MTYSTSGWAATATLPGKVQGVERLLFCEEVLDHFKCYTTNGRPEFERTEVDLTDQFGNTEALVRRHPDPARRPRDGAAARALLEAARDGKPAAAAPSSNRGWLLAQVWDRWRDRPFWSSQQAIRNVRDQADVVLTLKAHYRRDTGKFQDAVDAAGHYA